MLVIFILLVFFAFDQQSLDYSPRLVDENNYVEIDLSILSYRERIYLPVYSYSYFSKDEDKYSMMASVHFENKSRIEPIYILSADYYNSNGILSQKLIEKTIRINPLESNFLVLNSDMLTNSPGLMVLVSWGTNTIDRKPNIYIELSFTSATGKNTITEEGITISDQDEILDRRPL